MKIVLAVLALVGYFFWVVGIANPFAGSAGGYFTGGTVALVGAFVLRAVELRQTSCDG
jgi:hypothetical protein